MLEILYQDEHLVAINKPNGLLVHRSPIARDAHEFALQMLREQLGQYVYPIHRLDRKTSGILLFGLNASIVPLIKKQFDNGRIQKKYLAIVRGFFPDKIRMDRALTNDRGKTQDAITDFVLLEKTEVDVPLGAFNTSRYSLIAAYPKTGRMHQIRKHCNHLRHPIIGDRPHGCNKQNKLFKEKWQMTTMLLHAYQLLFYHPILHQEISIEASIPLEFQRMLHLLRFRRDKEK